jgi:hypothetical protein
MQKVMTNNYEKRSFWHFVLASGLTLLVIPWFGDDRFISIECTAGAALTIAAVLRLQILKRQRRMAVARGNAGHLPPDPRRSDGSGWIARGMSVSRRYWPGRMAGGTAPQKERAKMYEVHQDADRQQKGLPAWAVVEVVDDGSGYVICRHTTSQHALLTKAALETSAGP